MIDAAIFDMDGLLIDSEPFWRRAQLFAFGTVGLNLSEDDMRHTMGRRIDEVVAHWWHERPWEGATQKDIEALIVDKVIELVKTEGIPLPGVMEVIELFKAKAIPMAIASSSSGEIIRAVVDKLQIGGYFSHVYSAEHETHGKPHPGVYITTASLLGVPAHRCLALEDSPSGVLSAKAAKMKCIAVPAPENKDHNYVKIADAVVDSLESVDEKLLESL
ncbi:MAG TPA: hexitol phosphatase HxpB [Candidatus Saccharimonadales bacterium]|nr:hexitol phosphatase HxpB [Candidatus Saccharimonadales bacterium]